MSRQTPEEFLAEQFPRQSWPQPRAQPRPHVVVQHAPVYPKITTSPPAHTKTESSTSLCVKLFILLCALLVLLYTLRCWMIATQWQQPPRSTPPTQPRLITEERIAIVTTMLLTIRSATASNHWNVSLANLVAHQQEVNRTEAAYKQWNNTVYLSQENILTHGARCKNQSQQVQLLNLTLQGARQNKQESDQLLLRLRDNVFVCSREYSTKYAQVQESETNLLAAVTTEQQLDEQLTALRARNYTRVRLLSTVAKQLTFYNNFLTSLGTDMDTEGRLKTHLAELEKRRQQLTNHDAGVHDGTQGPDDDWPIEVIPTEDHETFRLFHVTTAQTIRNRITSLEALIHDEQELVNKGMSPQAMRLKVDNLVTNINIKVGLAEEERKTDQVHELRLTEQLAAVGTKVRTYRSVIANGAQLINKRDACTIDARQQLTAAETKRQELEQTLLTTEQAHRGAQLLLQTYEAKKRSHDDLVKTTARDEAILKTTIDAARVKLTKFILELEPLALALQKATTELQTWEAKQTLTQH